MGGDGAIVPFNIAEPWLAMSKGLARERVLENYSNLAFLRYRCGFAALL
jgi:hypothetical protein